MADFVLSKRKVFSFALESNPDKVYTIPAIHSLSFEEGATLVKIDEEKNIPKRGRMIKEFILKYAPELEEAGLGDMDYFEIYGAYGMNEGRKIAGESKASQDS